jgi:hypothetical protein
LGARDDRAALGLELACSTILVSGFENAPRSARYVSRKNARANKSFNRSGISLFRIRETRMLFLAVCRPVNSTVRLLFCMRNPLRIRTLINIGFILFVSGLASNAQTSEPELTVGAVDGLQMTISENGLIKPGVPKLKVVFRNVVDHDLNINLGSVGGSSPRPCKLDNLNISCTFNFKLNVTDRDGATRAYTFRGMSFVAGRLDPYIVYLQPHSTYTLELGLDQFWSPATHEYQALALAPITHKISLEFEGREPGIVNLDQAYISKMTFWKGKLTSNSLSLNVAQQAQPNKSLNASGGGVKCKDEG